MNARTKTLRGAALVVCVAPLLLVGVGCAARSAEVVSKPAPPLAVRELDRLHAVGEAVIVGPFEITMTRANLLTTPAGTAQADIELQIRNPQSPESDDATAIAPPRFSADSVRLVDSSGTVLPGHGLGMSPPPPLPGERRSPRDMLPHLGLIAPGQSMALYPQYVVPLDAKELTLYFTPIASKPDVLVKFKVK